LPLALTVIDPDSSTGPPDAVIDTSPPWAVTGEESTKIEPPAENDAPVPAATGELSLTVIDPPVAVNFALPAVAVTGEFVSITIEPPAVNDTFWPAITLTPFSEVTSPEADTITFPDALTVIDPDRATAPPDAVIDTSPPFAFTDDAATEIDAPALKVTPVPAVTGDVPDTVIEPPAVNNTL
jgi:hypothetical protein